MTTVEFFIFELADGDVRKRVTFMGGGNVAWKLNVLYQVALGIDQLHRHGVAHQDVKPSNILTMPQSTEGKYSEIKLADLGRAIWKGRSGPFDALPFAGDGQYAPLEVHYGFTPQEWVDRREAYDCYLLGSMLSYLFCGAGMNQLMFMGIDEVHYPGNWRGSFEEILPVFQGAHAAAIARVSQSIRDDSGPELLQILRELTDPNPQHRGDPKARRQVGRPVGLDRYVSRFDRLWKSANLKSKLVRS